MEVQEQSIDHLNSSILFCEICGISVKNSDYEKHLKNHSKPKRVEVCPYCSKEFTNLSNFKYHLAHHGSDRPWLCNECPKNYKTKIDLLQHQKSHDKMRDPLDFFCEKCKEFFKNRSSFNAHMKRHNSIKGPQECSECNKTFINLRSHIQQVHERLRRYICSICDKNFGKRSGLNRHIQTVHEKLRKFSCDLCDRSFGEKIQAQRHRNIHFKSVSEEPDYYDESMVDEEVIEDKRRFICGICKRKVNSRAALKRHKMIVHEKKRPFLCDLCPRSYGEKSNLMRHISKAHLEIEDTIIIEKLDEAEVEETFECKYCYKILTTQWGLKIHEEECQIKKQIKVNDKIDDNQSSLLIEIEKVSDDKDTLSILKCHSCDASFKAKRYFLQHLKTIHGDENKNFPCQHCKEIFTHRSQRMRHIRKNHSEIFEEDSKISKEKSNRSCGICSKVFKSEKFLQVHNSTEHKSKIYECPMCNRKFSFKQSMERHMIAIHEDRRDFKCSFNNCDRTFRSQYELKEHTNKVHEEVKKEIPIDQLTCDVCEKVCSTKKVLYSHKKYVHEGLRWGSNTFKCKLCLEKFDSKYKKTKHWQQVHHNGEVKTRTCRFCNTDFILYDDFKNHVDSHNECLICLICGHYFLEPSALLLHEESHKKIDEDLRQFVCDVCSHRLSTKGQLQVHMKKHFPESDQYICDICGKSYKFIAPFLHHKLTHQDTFDFECSYCHKPFRKKRDKVLHERIHTGERPYKCETCKKNFAFKQNYNKHVKTHQTKIFDCKICGISLSSAQLRLHEIKEHREEFPFKCDCGRIFKNEQSFNVHNLKCGLKIKFNGNVQEEF